jgi:hypothetical protein
MIYANKKINQSRNSAQQMALILSNVSALEKKESIRLTEDTIFLHPQLWENKISASNWMSCLLHYYIIKRSFKKSGQLYFKDITTDKLIGILSNGKPKVLKFG